MPRPQRTEIDKAKAAREFDRRPFDEYREPEPPTKAELFAASFTGTTPPDCLCGGGKAVALNSFNRPICRVCALLPEPGCDFYEGGEWRAELWQERSDEEWRRG